jgi:hypothetical protein
MGINDVSLAFLGWREEITGTRYPGNYVNGRWVDNTPIPLTFLGVVQNAEPTDLEVLEEGNRAHTAIKIHSVTRLYAQFESTQRGDEIEYDGSTWRVYWVARRKIGNYHKAIAVEVD